MKLSQSSLVTSVVSSVENPLDREGGISDASKKPDWDDVDWDKRDLKGEHPEVEETSPRKDPSAKPGHIHAIGGFRFLAALAVMIGHFRGRFGFGDFHAALGGRGVSFFFVLSGFILTYVYHKRLRKSGILDFYFKRIVRLWPLHVVCAFYAIFLIGQDIYPLRLAANLLLVQSWIPEAKWAFSYNGVSWSISTEMFFFFMFPFLLLGGQRQFWAKFAMVAMVSVCIVFMTQQLKNDPTTSEQLELIRIVHTNPLVRLVEFGLGMATAFLFLNAVSRRQANPKPLRDRKWLTLTDSAKEILAISTFVIFVFTYDLVRGFLLFSPMGGKIFSVWYHFAGSSIVFAVIIYVFANSKGMLAKLMGTKLMNFLGEISYAFFLVHNIILVYHSKVDWSASDLNRWLLAPCLVLMVLGLAIWLHFAIERPARDILMSTRKKGWRTACAEAWSQLWVFGFSRTGALCLVLCVSSWLAVRAQYTPLNLTPPMYETIFASDRVVRETRFGDKIRLMGCNVEAVDGGVEVKFVWQKLAPLPHFRFTHILGPNGEIEVLENLNKSFFKDADLVQPFEEVQFIPYEKLENGHRIGIGFHCTDIDPETNEPYGSLPMNRAAPGVFRPRLVIVHPGRLRRLKRKVRKLAREKVEVASISLSSR